MKKLKILCAALLTIGLFTACKGPSGGDNNHSSESDENSLKDFYESYIGYYTDYDEKNKLAIAENYVKYNGQEYSIQIKDIRPLSDFSKTSELLTEVKVCDGDTWHLDYYSFIDDSKIEHFYYVKDYDNYWYVCEESFLDDLYSMQSLNNGYYTYKQGRRNFNFYPRTYFNYDYEKDSLIILLESNSKHNLYLRFGSSPTILDFKKDYNNEYSLRIEEKKFNQGEWSSQTRISEKMENKTEFIEGYCLFPHYFKEKKSDSPDDYDSGSNNDEDVNSNKIPSGKYNITGNPDGYLEFSDNQLKFYYNNTLKNTYNISFESNKMSLSYSAAGYTFTSVFEFTESDDTFTFKKTDDTGVSLIAQWTHNYSMEEITLYK